jgi:hypothetical protein
MSNGGTSTRLTGNLDGMTDARMNQDNSMRVAYWLLGARLSILADQASTAGRYDLVEGQFFPGTQTPPHRQICRERVVFRAGSNRATGRHTGVVQGLRQPTS